MTPCLFLPGDGRVRAARRRPGSCRALLVAALLGILTLSACGTATSESPTAATVTNPDPEPVLTPSTDQVDVSPGPATGETPNGGLPWNDSTTQTCTAAVPPRFTQQAQAADTQAVTSFWSSGRQWMLCDVWGALAEEPGIISSPSGPQRGFNERALAVIAVPVADGVRFVAGGRLPWPVQEINYTFPDGHTEQAQFVKSRSSEDVWWVVAYTATEGPLADPATDPETLEPVTISIIGAAAEAFRLSWEDLQSS